MPNKNTIKKALKVQALLWQHYEPGRQDRCKLWVLRNVIEKQYPISQATFFRYLKMEETEKDSKKDNDRQLKLF